MLRTLSPHAIAHAARCTPDQIRDWRRQGFLTDYGERLGKGYLYNAIDAVSISLVVLLARCGMSSKSAFQIVRQSEWAVHGLLVGADGMRNGEYVIAISIDPAIPGAFSSVAIASISASMLNRSRPMIVHIALTTFVASVVDRLEAFNDSAAGRIA
jgi:hypothetical protein